MKELSGIDPELIKTYPVEFELDQTYDLETNDIEYRELSNDNEIGLVQPMVINRQVDPYTENNASNLSNKKEVIRTKC